MTSNTHTLASQSSYKLRLLFGLSGFAALCYQIVWQRLLYAGFGINIESVTLIVSLFMFGLGVGALITTRLDQYKQYFLLLFIACEIVIGVFGIISPLLIEWVTRIPHITSLWQIGAATYALFAIPTMMMGATLPLLVAHINESIGHTGKSMSGLYASNTLGAAIAAFLTVTVLFGHLGLKNTLVLAACCNAITAYLAWRWYARIIYAPCAPQIADTPATSSADMLSTRTILLLAFFTGYITLSQQIIWYRVLGFMTANHPMIFGLMLSAFLLGIVYAAKKSSQVYAKNEPFKQYLGSRFSMLLEIWIASFFWLAITVALTGKTWGVVMGLLLLMRTAYVGGGIFPVLCHLWAQRTAQSSNKSVGLIYFVNVMGATLGPLGLLQKSIQRPPTNCQSITIFSKK